MKIYLTTEEICESLKVSRQTVKNWRDKGLKFEQKGPKRFRYDPQDLKNFLKDKKYKF